MKERNNCLGNFVWIFKACNPEIAGFCIDAEEEATRVNGRDDMIFWNLLYKLNPQTTDFYWKGHIYQGLPALGREVLENSGNMIQVVKIIIMIYLVKKCFQNMLK